MPLRAEKQIETKRHVQAIALELFDARGFDAVTVDEIATASRVSAPTVYRQFGCKEQLVLWDDYDPAMFAAIAEQLQQETPLKAIRNALLGTLDVIYAEDAERLRRRSRLMSGHAGLIAASAAGASEARRQLAAMLLASPYVGGAFDASLIAAAVIGVLEVAVEEWLVTDGKTSLRAIFDEAFERLAYLTAEA